jgi:signal transduction histidine kinase
MFRGLRLRLTLLYVLAALAFVAVLSISTYHLLATYFERTTDLGLQHKMAHEFRLLGASVPPELAAADRDWFANRAILFPDPSPVSYDEDDEEREYEDDEDDEGDDYYEAEDYAEEFYDGELSAIFVLPLDAQGRLLFDPNPYTPPLPPNTAAVEAALEQGHDWRTITLANGMPVRLLTYRLTRDDGPAVLQLGRALIDQQRILHQLVLILLGVGSASVVVLGAGSWWLAGRSIVPAQQAWARQQAFVANASHELRTPLALIRASAEAAQRRLASDTARSHELLADIVSESDHTTALVNDLLLLSRLDAGRLELAPEPLDLPTFLGDLTRQAQPLAEQRSITLAADEVRGSVLADPARLHQVVLIVLDNALRHTPPGGSITLAAQPDGKQVQIQVTDTGSGIPAADLPHVFERFYRSAEARAEGGGSGLGLAIARALVAAMQGHITLESTAGQGTTVTLVLPAERW